MPGLRFLLQMDQILLIKSGTENRIATARRDYNEAVKEYNLKIKRFPTNLMAGMFGYSQRDYFEASEQSKEVPNVNFD